MESLPPMLIVLRMLARFPVVPWRAELTLLISFAASWLSVFVRVIVNCSFTGPMSMEFVGTSTSETSSGVESMC